ncbi:MAG: class A beta-lactamase-related serine hydrolase [Patescibacteria group bacterium]|nr:class A beta-lactamase-related serine hydrolase [Patescibacteria group bacterium]
MDMTLRYHKRVGSRGKRWLFVILALSFVLVIFGGYLWFREVNMVKNDSSNNESPIDLLRGEPVPEPVVKKDTEEVESEIEKYLEGKTGTYGYHVIELDDGRSYGTRDSEYYTAASTVKVAIATYAYNQIEAGEVSPEKVLTYTSADYEGGTGSLQADPVGSTYKVSYLLERMIVVSDNVATNILMRYLGRSNIQNYLDRNSLPEIKVTTNDVTPRAMASLLQRIYEDELISEKHKTELLSYMKKSITKTRLVAGVPKGIEVAHKIGSWSGAISDIGIVYTERPYAIAVYSEGVAWGEETDAVIAGISRIVYDFESSF